MIAYWMLYCAAVGALLGLGALALERAARPLGQATRWGWSAALVLTLAVPAAVRFLPTLRPAPPPPPAPIRAEGVTATVATLPRRVKPGFDFGRLDAPLAAAWGASSAAVVVVLAAMAVVLERRRRRWARAEVDGVPVLVSVETGPAVVGLLRSRIVLPRWAVEADPEARRLVVEHEQEHVRAGDPRLLALALSIAALMPWNPAVWWQLRRLRLAVEVDCDARVLRRRADVGAYGAVLLEVGRRTLRSPLAVAAFAEPVSFLERRIRIMTAPPVRRPFVRAAAFGALAAALAAAACETPVPTQPSAGTARSLYRAPGEQGLRSKISPREAIVRYFPQVAREGLGENEYLLFLLAPDGEVIRHERMQGSGGEGVGLGSMADDIPLNTVRSVEVMKRPAGELGPTRVAILWIQLKGEGDPSDVTTYSVQNMPGEESPYRVEITPGGAIARRTQGGDGASGIPTPEEMQTALRRFYTPEMEARGPHGEMRIVYRFDANGQPTDVRVSATPAELEPVARQIAGALDLGHGKPGTEAQVWMSLGGTRQPLRHPGR